MFHDQQNYLNLFYGLVPFVFNFSIEVIPALPIHHAFCELDKDRDSTCWLRYAEPTHTEFSAYCFQSHCTKVKFSPIFFQ